MVKAKKKKHDEDERDEDDIRIEKMFKRMRKMKTVARVGDVFVDIPGAIQRMTACSDGICMTTSRLSKLTGKTCCTTFNVPLEKDDVERVSKCVDEVRKIRDVDDAIKKADGWWYIEDDELFLEDRPSGACVFLSAPKGDRPWCTIHEWAVNNGKEFRDYKPETCCLFPLYILENDEEVLVTGYGSPLMREAEPDEADDIQEFNCLHPPKGQGTSILADQADELRYRLGADRWDGVLAKLKEMELM